MTHRYLLLPALALIAGCQTVQPAPTRGFSPAQQATLQENGFKPSGDNWEFGLADRLLFASDSANLLDDQRVALSHTAAALAKVDIHGARVEGHTDRTGSATYNEALSLKRATAVADALRAGGLDGDRLVVRGLGARYPVMSNITAAGRTENRRVVIIVSPDDARPAAAPPSGAVR